MIKSKSGITHLDSNTLPVVVMQNVFSLLPVSIYQLPLTTWNRCQPADSSGTLPVT